MGKINDAPQKSKKEKARKEIDRYLSSADIWMFYSY